MLPNFRPPETKLSNFKSFDRNRQNSLFKQIVTSGRRINFEASSRPDSKSIKHLASIDSLAPKRTFEASAFVRPNPSRFADAHSRKSTDFLASVDSARKQPAPLVSKLSEGSSKAVFQKIRLFPSAVAPKKDTPVKAQVSSIIFNPEKATNNRQTMTCNFLREKFGPEKFEMVRRMYLEKQAPLRDIEGILTDSQKCLVKLFPIAFDFSTPTTQESRLSGRCSFK